MRVWTNKMCCFYNSKHNVTVNLSDVQTTLLLHFFLQHICPCMHAYIWESRKDMTAMKTLKPLKNNYKKIKTTNKINERRKQRKPKQYFLFLFIFWLFSKTVAMGNFLVKHIILSSDRSLVWSHVWNHMTERDDV